MTALPGWRDDMENAPMTCTVGVAEPDVLGPCLRWVEKLNRAHKRFEKLSGRPPTKKEARVIAMACPPPYTPPENSHG